jgi:hypothetical protein
MGILSSIKNGLCVRECVWEAHSSLNFGDAFLCSQVKRSCPSPKSSKATIKRMESAFFQSLKVSALYCMGCFVVQEVFRILLRRVPDDVATKGIKEQTANRGVSTIHAMIMFFFAAKYWLTINPGMKLIKASGYEDFCIDLMLGYLYYDAVQELKALRQLAVDSKFGPAHLDTIGHHLMGALSHWTTRFVYNESAYFYTMVVYVAEASTPFLHTCWTMHTFKLSGHPVFLPLCGMLLLTFFIFRIIQGGYIVWHIFSHWQQWGGNVALKYLNTVVLLLFVCLNSYWFIKLIQMATGLGKPKKAKKAN